MNTESNRVPHDEAFGLIFRGVNINKKLYKSNSDKKIDGVCAGIAEFFEIDSTIVRLIWVLVVLFAGSGILLYIIAALVMPRKPEDQ